MVNVTLPGRNKPLHTVKGKGYCCHSNSAGAKVRLETYVLWRRLKRTAPSPNSTTVKVKLLLHLLCSTWYTKQWDRAFFSGVQVKDRVLGDLRD